MKALFEIECIHEYFGGRTPHLDIQTLPFVQNLIHKDRLRVKFDTGAIQCLCEDDEEVLEEYTELCFWLSFNNEDFVHYSDFSEELVFNTPRLQWTQPKQGEEQTLVAEELSKENEKKWVTASNVPNNTIGIIIIPTTLLKKQSNFQIQFKTKQTFWEYKIHSKQLSKDWSFSVEDKEQEWLFESSNLNENRTFRSSAPIPYQRKASDRLQLKWENQEDAFQYQHFKKNLPFPNYRFQRQEDTVKISPIHITI